MKRTALLLLAALLLFTLTPSALAQSSRVEIASREALQRIADNPAGDYVLTADIDLGDAPWTPIPFSGTLDGAGHTIGNLTVRNVGNETHTTYDGNYKAYESSFAGLFSVAEDAEIQDLHLINADLRIETDANCFLGAIAGYAARTTITDCSVTMRGWLTLTSADAGVGGLIGFAYDCLVENCTADAELVFIDANPDILCEEFLGGVFACGFGTVRGCTVRTRGYADIYGYAHNGGVIGMFKLSQEKPKGPMYLRDTTVDAEIHFFESTPSRRAYCKAFIGEDNVQFCRLKHNRATNFVRAESREPAPQRPETCASPAYVAAVTEPTCTKWGYTTYTCETCSYTYRDHYTLPRHSFAADVTPPTCTEAGRTVYTCMLCGESYTETTEPTGHVPGNWIVVRAAAIGQAGEEQCLCAVCGAPLDTRAIPALDPIPVETVTVDVASITLNTETLALHVDDTAVLTASVLPTDATDRRVVYESANSGVVTVDETGRVTAVGEGMGTITVRSADGQVSAVCAVSVTRTFWQKIKRFFSFAWLRCA